MYHHGTVELYPESPRRGQEVAITYNGILAQSGADAIWLHYGHDNWRGASFHPMEKQGHRFTCQVKAEGRKSLDFCFKDSANNWDNNNGMDWGCSIK